MFCATSAAAKTGSRSLSRLYCPNLPPLVVSMLSVIQMGGAETRILSLKVCLCTCNGVNATLELVPDDRSLTVDLPPYVMLCFCNVRCNYITNKTFKKWTQT